MMQIEAGKYYRTRDGRKVGPAKFTPEKFYEDQGYPWSVNTLFMYQPSGVAGDGGHEEYDLVSEWVDAPAGPVREVTRKEIVPGLYSHIRVWPNSPHGHVRVSIQEMAGGHASYDFHPSELRAAADVLIQLADALEPKP